MIGKTISHYRILEKLGEGGMGVVYKAQDLKLDRFVALKFLPPDLTASETDRARFLQEAKAASAINHPNVCIIHDIQEHDGQQFIVMEYIEGQTLREIIAENLPKVLSLRKVIDYGIQIAEALGAAHSKGIVHRDIKSENIMVTATNQIKVMDFGLAKLRGALKLTKTSSTVGTLAYMAPEQIEGREVDARSDIFSFGVVLYEMLTGQLPFRGEYESAMMYSILSEEPEPAQKYRPDLPSEFLHVLNRALEKGPQDRYQAVSDMLIDLRRLKRDTSKVSRESLKEMPVSHVPKKPEAAKISPKRKPFWIGIGSAAILLLLIIWFISKKIFQGQPGPAVAKENSIAVMYFENRSGEPDLEKILVDMLTTNLSRYEEIDVVSSQRLFDILKLIGKQDAETIDKHVATEVANRAGVKTMLLGSIIQIGNKIRITAQLTDVQTGGIIGSDQVEGNKIEEVFDLVDMLTEKVRDKLGISTVGTADQRLKIADVTTNSFEAYKYYQKGLENLWRWNFSGAKANFQRAIDIDSTFAMAYLQLALTEGRFGLNMLDPFYDLSPVKTLLKLAQKYAYKVTNKEHRLIDVNIALFNRDFKSTDSLATKLVEKYPKEKYGLYLLATTTWWAEQDFERTKTACEKILEIDPTDANTYNSLSYIHSYLNDHTAAISTVKKYVALHPDVYNAYDSAWEIHLRAGKFDDALTFLEEGVTKIPDWHWGHQYIGYTLLLKGDGDGARAKFRQVAELIPTAIVRHTRNIGLSYLFEGRLKQAIAEFRKAVELAQKENSAERGMYARFDLGKILVVQKNYAQAIQEYSRAEKLSWKIYNQNFNPIPIVTNYLIGIAMVKKGDYEAAQSRAEDIKRMIQEQNFDDFYLDFYYLLLGELYVAQRNGKAAETVIDKTSTITMLYSPHYRKIAAAAYVLQGNYEKAVETYHSFYTSVEMRRYGMGDNFYFFRERSIVDYNIAQTYEKMGDNSQAIEYYQKFLDQWKNADKNLPELIDAKKRLSEIKAKSSL